MLYQKISKKGKEKNAVNTEIAVSRMLVMAKVLYGLHLVSLYSCSPNDTYTLPCLVLPFCITACTWHTVFFLLCLV